MHLQKCDTSATSSTLKPQKYANPNFHFVAESLTKQNRFETPSPRCEAVETAAIDFIMPREAEKGHLVNEGDPEVRYALVFVCFWDILLRARAIRDVVAESSFLCADLADSCDQSQFCAITR